jgi:hypothetical protein
MLSAGQVLADERIMKPQFITEDDRLAVLTQHLGIVAMQRVHRHGEVT